MLVVDVSLSMEATDVSPSRLEAAQQAATNFANNLTQGVNLGLVSYALTAWASYGLADARVLGALALGALAGLGFVLRERSAREPLVQS